MRDLASRRPFRLESKVFLCSRSKREKRMLSRGSSIIDKELEIDHFLRSMRMLRIALKTLFSRTEMFLIRNNKAFTLNSESSEAQPL